MFLKTEVYTI